MLITIPEFLGRFHPVLVHLPIGILLVACVLQWLSSKERFAGMYQAIGVTLLLGMISSVFSAVTGYFLSISEDYDEGMVNVHFWLGILTSLVSLIFYFLHRSKSRNTILHVVATLLFILVVLTGHFGGSLTHGSDYLSLSSLETEPAAERKVITNVQEAMLYADLVQPVLQSKCYSCHGKSKQKGGLRMDDSARLWKGGKDGIVLVAGKPDESEMIKRLLLPRNDDDHMPPKEKPQLNDQEVALLHWWISAGAPFNKKVKELPQTEKQKTVLISFEGAGPETAISDIPVKPVEAANPDVIDRLRKKGIVVLPVSQNSNYLMASFVTLDSVVDNDLAVLEPLQKQLVWLKLGNTYISDSSLSMLTRFKNLTRLQLDHTKVSDTGLVQLRSLENLQYLNLVGTQVTAKGVMSLKGLKNLQSMYLYQTNVSSAEWAGLKNNFPGVNIDSGGYVVPIFESDTTEVKMKK